MAGPRAVVKLDGDGSGFDLMMKRAQGGLRSLGRDAAGDLKSRLAGLFALGAIEEGFRRTIKFASAIEDASGRTGASTTALQEFAFAAEQTGAHLEDVVSVLEKLGVARQKALAGDKAVEKSFARLGLNKQATPEDLLRQMGAFVKSKGTLGIESDLRELGGRGVGQLVPAMREGLDELIAQANKLGAILRPEQISALDTLGDKFTMLEFIVRAQLAPAIIQAGAALIGFVGQLRQSGSFWSKVGPDLLKFPVAEKRDIFGKSLATGLSGLLNKVLPGSGVGLAMFDTMLEIMTRSARRTGAVTDMDKIAAETKAAIDAFLNAKPKEKLPPIGETPIGGKIPRGRESSDAMVRVGNFLGANAGSRIVNLHEQQLARQTRMVALLQSIDAALKRGELPDIFVGEGFVP